MDLYLAYQLYQQQVYSVLVVLFIFSAVLVLGWAVLPWLFSKSFLRTAQTLYAMFAMFVYLFILCYFIRPL